MDIGYFLFMDAQEDEPIVPSSLNPFASEDDDDYYEEARSAGRRSRRNPYYYYDMED